MFFYASFYYTTEEDNWLVVEMFSNKMDCTEPSHSELHNTALCMCESHLELLENL